MKPTRWWFALTPSCCKNRFQTTSTSRTRWRRTRRITWLKMWVEIVDLGGDEIHKAKKFRVVWQLQMTCKLKYLISNYRNHVVLYTTLKLSYEICKICVHKLKKLTLKWTWFVIFKNNHYKNKIIITFLKKICRWR